MAAMKRLASSPWFGVSMVIIGLVAGYAFVIAGNPEAFAGSNECPATTEHCLNGDCGVSDECKNGECSQNCPGNCTKQS